MPKLPAESERRRRVTKGVRAAKKSVFKGTRTADIASNDARNIQVRQAAEAAGGVRRGAGVKASRPQDRIKKK